MSIRQIGFDDLIAEVARLGLTVEDATAMEWHNEAGDTVEAGEVIGETYEIGEALAVLGVLWAGTETREGNGLEQAIDRGRMHLPRAALPGEQGADVRSLLSLPLVPA